jgi:hypothetical protein
MMRDRRRLAVLLSLTACAIVIGVAAFAAFINYTSGRVAYLSMVEARLDLVAARVAGVVERALSLGVPLEGQTSLPRVMTEEAESDALIRTIRLGTADGRVLWESEGTPPPASGLEVPVQVVPIVSDAGVGVGELVVEADGATVAAVLEGHWRAVVTVAVATGAVGGLLSVLAVLLLLRRGEEAPADHALRTRIDADHAWAERRLGYARLPEDEPHA